ncbi:MAG: SDR family oxidoreductase [Nitratireductor sp.]|nr:SDR family oxidoreductase [Nitratireductor sp.]
MSDMHEFEWPAAIVTGGGSGLGRAIAIELAKNGVDVWIAGRRLEPLEETRELAGAAPGKIHPHSCDLRDPEACQGLIEAVTPQGAGILVNNAAGTFVALAEDISPNGWRSVIEASLNAPFYVTSAWCKRQIREKKGGVVLNVASATTDGGSPGTVHSGAAKSGLVSMTKTLATEWARYGIRVNAISPGPFETPGAADWIWTQEGIRKRIEDAVPVGYIAPLQEIVDPALFLLSKAGRYTNGSILKVDGGWTLTDWLYIKPDN